MIKHLMFFLFIVSLIGFGCAPKGPSEPVSEGERLFRNRCSSCHRLPELKQKDWPAILNKHMKRAKLNEAQQKMLLDFFNSSLNRQQTKKQQVTE